jgi:chemotaxis regulatin CheY-phosphate phosphatase CheZ
MPAPRKIFRIEEAAAARYLRSGNGAPASADPAEVIPAPGAFRATIAPPSPRQPTAAADRAPVTALHAAQMKRVARELAAVTAGATQATQKILAAAEEIDQIAHNLAASLKDKIEQDAAADISDLVIRIFEACNFQDLNGQRIAKVMTTLKFAADRASAERDGSKSTPSDDDAAQLLHGPRLDGDSGHITQAEIDALFDN